MKKLLLLLLIYPGIILAQNKPIDSFWGVKFGATKAEVKSAFTAKGATLDVKSSSDKFWFFDDITFAQRKAYILMLKFTNDKFYQAVVTFKPAESNLIEEFETIVKELSGTYGQTKVYRSFKSPYEDGDGYELSAIKLGKAEYAAFWKSVNPSGDKNYISISITKDMLIRLDYQDGTLVKDEITVQEQQKAKDY